MTKTLDYLSCKENWEAQPPCAFKRLYKTNQKTSPWPSVMTDLTAAFTLTSPKLSVNRMKLTKGFKTN